MKVRDVMTPEVATVRPDAPLKDVARLLAKCRAGVGMLWTSGERRWAWCPSQSCF